MSTDFNPLLNLIVITARLWGPIKDTIVVLALDTGATSTLINTDILQAIGVDLLNPLEMVRITTGSGIEYVPVFSLDRIEALEQERWNLPVVAHDLPPSAIVDGVLGLDYLRGKRLCIDFDAGEITLT